MRVLTAVLAVGALAAAVFGMQQQSARGAPSAGSKVIDRTVSCTVGLTGGIRKVELTANTGTRVSGKPSVWKLLPTIEVEDLGTGAAATVAAGNPLAPIEPGFPARPERLFVSSSPTCKPAPRIASSRKGLVPTTVTALPQGFGSGISCYPGKRVVYRVRGIFTAPTSLHAIPGRGSGHGAVGASGTIAVGYLAVGSASGKTLAYGEVFQNGKAKLFVARSCDQ